MQEELLNKGKCCYGPARTQYVVVTVCTVRLDLTLAQSRESPSVKSVEQLSDYGILFLHHVCGFIKIFKGVFHFSAKLGILLMQVG